MFPFIGISIVNQQPSGGSAPATYLYWNSQPLMWNGQYLLW